MRMLFNSKKKIYKKQPCIAENISQYWGGVAGRPSYTCEKHLENIYLAMLAEMISYLRSRMYPGVPPTDKVYEVITDITRKYRNIFGHSFPF